MVRLHLLSYIERRKFIVFCQTIISKFWDIIKVVKYLNSYRSYLEDFSSNPQLSHLLKFSAFSSLISMIIILMLVGISIHFLFIHFLISEAVKIGLALLEQEKEILIDQGEGGKNILKLTKMK